MGDMTKNFNRSEFACKCGCGFDKIDPRVVNIAQAIRDYVNVSVRINSGCRCENHNAKVGGVKGSNHTLGLAADLSCSLGAEALFLAAVNLFAEDKIPELAYCQWYKGKDFVHVDVGRKRNHRFAIVK